MKFNEDSRVKIPAILHLCRLGYTYVSLKDARWDKETNFFTDIFLRAMTRINPEMSEEDVWRFYKDLSLDLENEDLGKAFYQKLTERSGVKLVDFKNFHNNDFHVVTELPCEKDDDSFRPDITLLINGMPLVFIEVKKPNNREGVIAERNRMARRYANKNFRKFLNVTQLMVFSNNMEYDDGEVEPIQGAFYATTSYGKPHFNYFREEDDAVKNRALPEVESGLEDFILKDTNLTSIKHSNEFQTNKNPNTPTNRICTSLFSRERLKFFLQYSIAYVDGSKGLEKHIMRYPQFFGSKAIANKLDEGVKKGIIWHTQGSGKTALAYYNVHHLTDYYQAKGVVPKFYFIVDRLDLLTQASGEFTDRGLKVHTINSREDFAQDIKSSMAVHNDRGVREITVVNIQKFQDDPNVIEHADYSVNLQRVYFLDEVHRSYNPKGSFLANLKESDPHAIKIGLTGTPLLGDDYNSRLLFGDYIHKYYYNASIKDGYTLRLIREEIATNYRLELEQLLKGNKSPVLVANDDTIENPSVFALEMHLEEFLVANWKHTELGKQYDIYEDQGEIVGQQYQTDTGKIDILAISKDSKELLVLELKKGRTSDAVVGQIQRYMGYVIDELAENNQTVRGIIIGLEDDLRIRRALSVAKNIEFYRYEVSFKLKKHK